MDKQTAVHPYIGTLQINKKEHNANTWSAVDEPLMHNIAQKSQNSTDLHTV